MLMYLSLTLFFIMFSVFINPMVNLIFILAFSLMGAQTFFLMSQAWLSFIMILIYSGGMLVLFLFVISLTPNYKGAIPHSFLLFVMSMISVLTVPKVIMELKASGSFFPIFFLSKVNFYLICLILLFFLMVIMKMLMIPNKTMKFSF